MSAGFYLILLALCYKPSVSFTLETSRRPSGAERGRVRDGWQRKKQNKTKQNKAKEADIYTPDGSLKGRDEPV